MTFTQPGRKRRVRVLGGVGILLAALWVTLTWIAFQASRSLDSWDRAELRATLRRWIENGQPSGRELEVFMQGKGSHLVVSNRTFTIDGQQYKTQFAIIEPRTKRAGVLFITTNAALIWTDGSGTVRLR